MRRERERSNGRQGELVGTQFDRKTAWMPTVGRAYEEPSGWRFVRVHRGRQRGARLTVAIGFSAGYGAPNGSQSRIEGDGNRPQFVGELRHLLAMPLPRFFWIEFENRRGDEPAISSWGACFGRVSFRTDGV